MIRLLKEFDKLSHPLPTFTYKGRTELRTILGSFLSIIIYSVTLMFALQKMKQLLEKHNPQIVIIEDDIDLDATFDTSDPNFMMAFAAETYSDEVGKSDPRFLRWVTSFWIKDKDGNFIEEEIPMHRCTDEEFA